MESRITFLQIIEDNDGEYDFPTFVDCASVADAIHKAWNTHSNFMSTKEGEDFRGEEALNSDEDEFVKSLATNGVVVTASEDMNCRRIYKLITIKLDTTVSTAHC
jgi:hypothetical protein